MDQVVHLANADEAPWLAARDRSRSIPLPGSCPGTSGKDVGWRLLNGSSDPFRNHADGLRVSTAERSHAHTFAHASGTERIDS